MHGIEFSFCQSPSICFWQLAARVMMNVLSILHAYAESAKTRADLKDVDRMLSALWETTGPNATVCQATEAILTRSAGSTSASLIQSVPLPRLVGMKSVWIHATVQSMPTVLQGTTEEFVHVILAIQEIRTALSVQRVSLKLKSRYFLKDWLENICNFQYPSLTSAVQLMETVLAAKLALSSKAMENVSTHA